MRKRLLLLDPFKLQGGGIETAEINKASKVKLHTILSFNRQQKKPVTVMQGSTLASQSTLSTGCIPSTM